MGERCLIVQDFDLRLTLESGQFFRYEEHGEGYLLLTQGKAVVIRQEDGALCYGGADEEFIRHLFQLVPQYDERIARLRADPVLLPVVAMYPGLRVMRQDLHEATLGFICSSMSNIPKIRLNLRLIAQSCGRVVGGHAHLPLPGQELDLGAVTAAKTGYRAKFLVGTNALLTGDMLNELSVADYDHSHELLKSLPGIGPKVADCICLFALGHGEAFPVDVHVLRAMQALFPHEHFSDERRARDFAQHRWGKDAGLAQQFIFQWARDNLARKVRKVEVIACL
jgi:N-glycosylase/DNA lyase